MLTKTIKQYTDNILPLSFYNGLNKIGITPNKITFIALFTKIAVLYFFYTHRIFLGGLFIALDYVLDFIDGTFARRLNKQTAFGVFFDTVLDRLFRTIGWPLALAFGHAISFEIAALLIAFNLFLIFSSNVIESNNLKHFHWMPTVIYLIPYGALINRVEEAANIEVVVAFTLLTINTLSVIIINLPKK